MKPRMFRTLCLACEERAIAKAAGTEGQQVLVVGCEHHQVAATLIVEAGLILNWTTWPAPDVEAFARGALLQASALQTVLEGQSPASGGTQH